MAKSRLFEGVRRALGIARFAESEKISTSEALERVAEAEHAEEKIALSRRAMLGGLATGAAGVALGVGSSIARPSSARAARAGTRAPRIAIVGGGLAGLVCADRLASRGYAATIYEANTRLGGRTHSTRVFPGQVAELGGELIDNPHKSMLRLANRFNLLKEDVKRAPGAIVYWSNGQRYSEAEVIDEWRVLVNRLRPDYQMIGSPTFFDHTAAEAALDQTDLASYLWSRAPDLPLIRSVLDVAYNIEYGVEISQQSCLSLLEFIHLDRRSKFAPFGSSDERYHLVGGNDQVAANLAAGLPGPILTDATLVRLGKNGLGEFELWLRGASTPETADAVVLAIPFSVLRTVTLDASLGLSADKLRAIQQFAYGSNAKTMIGFAGRPWWTLHGSNGTVYSSGLPNLQNTWETSWTTAGATSVLTDYSGGNRGAALSIGTTAAPLTCGSCHGSGASFFDIHDETVQAQADAFLTDLDRVLPGTKAAATVTNGKYLVARGHWLQQRYSRGSYSANAPGYFTTIEGLASLPAGLLKFAGEHTDSFYSWQGYMEGACLSGERAADELLDDLRAGRL